MVNALDEPVPSRGRAIWVICIVAPIITGIVVALRAYSRFFVTRRNYPSDWCCYATLPFLIAFSVTLAQAPYYGMGRHMWDLDAEMSSGMYFWILVSSEFYVVSLCGYKMALLLLYLQLFGVYRRYRYTVYAVMFYTCSYLFCNLIVEVAGCQPIQKFWNPDLPGHCTDSVAQDIAFGVGHMTSDLMIAILPLPIVLRLQLRSGREKFGLACVLGTGVIAWVVAVVRFTYASVDLTSSDRTWIAGVTFFLSVLEVNTGLICGCMPALKPIVVGLRDASFSWSRKYSISDWSRKRSLGYLRKFSAPFNPTDDANGNAGANVDPKRPSNAPAEHVELAEHKAGTTSQPHSRSTNGTLHKSTGKSDPALSMDGYEHDVEGDAESYEAEGDVEGNVLPYTGRERLSVYEAAALDSYTFDAAGAGANRNSAVSRPSREEVEGRDPGDDSKEEGRNTKRRGFW